LSFDKPILQNLIHRIRMAGGVYGDRVSESRYKNLHEPGRILDEVRVLKVFQLN